MKKFFPERVDPFLKDYHAQKANKKSQSSDFLFLLKLADRLADPDQTAPSSN